MTDSASGTPASVWGYVLVLQLIAWSYIVMHLIERSWPGVVFGLGLALLFLPVRGNMRSFQAPLSDPTAGGRVPRSTVILQWLALLTMAAASLVEWGPDLL